MWGPGGPDGKRSVEEVKIHNKEIQEAIKNTMKDMKKTKEKPTILMDGPDAKYYAEKAKKKSSKNAKKHQKQREKRQREILELSQKSNALPEKTESSQKGPIFSKFPENEFLTELISELEKPELCESMKSMEKSEISEDSEWSYENTNKSQIKEKPKLNKNYDPNDSD